MFHKSIAKVNKEEGFTLVELLVVILIIGILTAIAVPSFLNQRQQALDDSVQSDLKSVANAVDRWKMNHPKNPITEAVINDQKSKVKISEGNSLTVVSTSSTAGYILCGKNPDGKVSKTGYTFRQAAGGSPSRPAGINEEPC